MNDLFNNIEDPKVPHHDALQSRDAFKVPDSYFDNLTERIMTRIEMEAISIPANEKTFQVPAGYFETFTNRLMDKIHKQSMPKTIQTSFQRNFIYSAAAAVVLILVSWFIMSLYSKQSSVDYLALSSEEELLEYVSLYAYEFDQNSLAVVMNEEDINSLDILEDMDDETSDLLIELFE